MTRENWLELLERLKHSSARKDCSEENKRKKNIWYIDGCDAGVKLQRPYRCSAGTNIMERTVQLNSTCRHNHHWWYVWLVWGRRVVMDWKCVNNCNAPNNIKNIMKTPSTLYWECHCMDFCTMSRPVVIVAIKSSLNCVTGLPLFLLDWQTVIYTHYETCRHGSQTVVADAAGLQPPCNQSLANFILF